MSKEQKIKDMLSSLYSISDETRENIKVAKDIEKLIEIIARELPQMAQAIAFLNLIDILKKHV